jgi:hypothetical protein
MSQLEFDEEQAQKIKAFYRIGDAVRRRRIVRDALAAEPGECILDVGCSPEIVPYRDTFRGSLESGTNLGTRFGSAQQSSG